jgi:GTPase SAR1 family protein
MTEQHAAGPGAVDVSRRLQQTLNSSLAVFREFQRPDLVASVREAVERPRSAHPVVVVAGETKRGKSSLVNALLRHSELSPTGAGTATNTYLMFSYAEQPSASVVVGDDNKRQPIGLDDLATWATVDGNPDNRRRVRHVDVALDAPVLKSLILIDTPGVGGLDSAHGALTLVTIRQADAIVFVVDAGAPLSAPELAFLETAGDHVDTIVLALTKTDDYRGWERILDDDVTLLRRYAPELASCPVVPVSSRLAEASLQLEGTPAADRLWDESGFGRLAAILDERVVRRAGSLRAANAVQTARRGLRAVGEVAATRLAAASGDQQLLAALQAEQLRLQNFGKQSAEWNKKLGSAVQKIKINHGEELGRGIAKLNRQYSDLVGKAKRHERETLFDRLVGDIEAFASSLAERSGLELAGLATELMGDVEGDTSLGMALANVSSAALGAGAVVVERPDRADLTKVDKLSTLVSFSSGRAIGGLAVPLVAGFGLPILSLGLGVGVAFSVLMTSGRREIAEQQNLKMWIQQQLNEAQRQISSEFARNMVDVQDELHDALVAYIEHRHGEVAAAIEEYGRAVQQDQAARQSSIQQARAMIGRLRGLLEETVALLSIFGSVRLPAASRT